MTDQDFIRREVQAICTSGALGRSRSYSRLLEYLADFYIEGKTPKQLEIASDVFGKGSDFDPSQESLVRVYIHNLRRKLEAYYGQVGGTGGYRIEIPKGEYRLGVVSVKNTVAKRWSTRGTDWKYWTFAAIAIAVLGISSLLILEPRQIVPTVYQQVANTPLWSKILTDETPIVVVVGDYYIFGELDETFNVRRLIREFSVNSAQDLSEFVLNRPELMGSYLNLDLTYLPSSSAFALKDLLPIVHTSEKPVRMISMSELDGVDLRSNHILYIGYISGLDKLMEFVFASSSLVLEDTYDELINRKTGEEYTSGAGIPLDHQGNYHDYGLLSTFPGPSGNQFVVVAGARDEGLMHTAYAATDMVHIEALEQFFSASRSDVAPAFEILYEVTGFDRMTLDGALVHSAELDRQRI